MKTYSNGAPAVLNADGTAALVGYERVRHIDLVTGVEKAWPPVWAGHEPPTGAFYVGGWWDPDAPVVFTPTQANPPQTQAYVWFNNINEWGEIANPERAIGHGGLMVYDSDCLSTNSTTLWHNGQDITPPEPFSGVVWSGLPFYGYADSYGNFTVRRLSDGGNVLRILLGADQRPYSISGELWVSGYNYMLEGTVVTATGLAQTKTVKGEWPGPIFERNGDAYVMTGIIGRAQNPRGVMIRRWQDFRADGPGWFVEGIRHQFMQARVRPDGRIVVAGCEFPGAGILTVAEIDPASPRAVVPPEPVEAPPTPLPPVPTPTQPQPVPTPIPTEPAPPDPPPQDRPAPKPKPWNLKAWFRRWFAKR